MNRIRRYSAGSAPILTDADAAAIADRLDRGEPLVAMPLDPLRGGFAVEPELVRAVRALDRTATHSNRRNVAVQQTYTKGASGEPNPKPMTVAVKVVANRVADQHMVCGKKGEADRMACFGLAGCRCRRTAEAAVDALVKIDAIVARFQDA